jgi:GNAT superfamily N-acetyltransferase
VTATQLQIVPFQADMAGDCRAILEALPEWFGIPESVDEYVRRLPELNTFVALVGGREVGFIAMERHFAESAETHVLGVRPEHHRQGIGRQLLNHAEESLRGEGVSIFFVKTLAPSDPYPPFALTRAFYSSCGYKPIFETAAFWGPENPAVVMVKACGVE